MQGSKSDKPTVLFILGGPGSGKGTQCKLIYQKYSYANFVHLSTGSLLRSAINDKSPNSVQINKLMKQGKMVSSPPLVNLIKQRINKDWKNQDTVQKQSHPYIFMVDGFPRNKENLQAWQDIIKDEFDVKFLLYFEVEENRLRERLLNRAKTSGRADDNPQTIEKRIKAFYSQTYPMLDLFQKGDGKVVRINGDQGIQQVSRDVTIQLKKNKLI